MNIQILFEKEGLNDKFKTGWGMSYLVGGGLLFDTGEKFEFLEHNAGIMGIDLSAIKKVVISHQHLGHVGGLIGFLQKYNKVTVYLCEHSSDDLKRQVKDFGAELVEVLTSMEIDKGIFTTGQVVASGSEGLLAEQALLIKDGEKNIVMAGCCHSGVLNIFEKINFASGGRITADLFIGGTHLMEKDKRYAEYIALRMHEAAKAVSLGHCTGFEAAEGFKKIYGDAYRELKSGMELT